MSERMNLVQALQTLAAARTNEVVLTSMGNAREWMRISDHPLDFVHVPSSMGQTPAFALGLALARPDRRVIACTGDGSLLMNLGSLVTITAHAPSNLVLILCDNSAYEVTGAQATAASPHGRQSAEPVDFAAIARASGFRSVHSFHAHADWQAAIPSILTEAGPVFVQLHVALIPGAVGPKSPGPAPERALAFRTALATNS